MVLGRAGEGGGNGGILEKLTKLFVILMKITTFYNKSMFFTKIHEILLKCLNPGRLGRLAARDTGARAGPWPGP